MNNRTINWQLVLKIKSLDSNLNQWEKEMTTFKWLNRAETIQL